jgi:signal transduction histidine kinase
LNSDQEFYLDCLNTAVNEADEIINDLLELSQVGRGKIEIKKINTVELITEIIDTYANSDDIKITMQDKFPIIKSETVLLRQIFQNLIANGIKFNNSSQKKIELGWKPVADNRIEFFIRDNGIGIASRHQKQIFRVFEKLHTKKEYEGSGIGLAIVKKAVNKLGGSIRVESKPGKGSIFIIIIPKE